MFRLLHSSYIYSTVSKGVKYGPDGIFRSSSRVSSDMIGNDVVPGSPNPFFPRPSVPCIVMQLYNARTEPRLPPTRRHLVSAFNLLGHDVKSLCSATTRSTDTRGCEWDVKISPPIVPFQPSSRSKFSFVSSSRPIARTRGVAEPRY